MLKQLSIYAENKKGTLEHITGVLLREEINILGSMTEDSAEYGVNGVPGQCQGCGRR